jgi:hypothetical protein
MSKSVALALDYLYKTVRSSEGILNRPDWYIFRSVLKAAEEEGLLTENDCKEFNSKLLDIERAESVYEKLEDNYYAKIREQKSKPARNMRVVLDVTVRGDTSDADVLRLVETLFGPYKARLRTVMGDFYELAVLDTVKKLEAKRYARVVAADASEPGTVIALRTAAVKALAVTEQLADLAERIERAEAESRSAVERSEPLVAK